MTDPQINMRVSVLFLVALFTHEAERGLRIVKEFEEVFPRDVGDLEVDEAEFGEGLFLR